LDRLPREIGDPVDHLVGVLMMVLGFWTATLYTLIALQSSGGDWRRFWMGHRTE
jgi:hypothetical protein